MQKCQAGPPFPPSSSAPALQLQLTWALVVACSGFLSSRSRMKRGKRRDIPFSLSTWGPQGDQTCLSEPRPQGKPMGGAMPPGARTIKKCLPATGSTPSLEVLFPIRDILHPSDPRVVHPPGPVALE